jgi:hypothetical protein
LKIPNAEYAIVPKAKVVNYLLSPTHFYGKTKEGFFTRFGFSLDEWEVFANSLKRFVQTTEMVREENSPFGKRFVVEGNLETPDGRNPFVRTIWFIENEEVIPHFVTAYPIHY